MRKPYYWKARKAWYVKDGNGSQIPLGKDKEAAFDKYHEMMATRHEINPSMPIVNLVDEFLAWVDRNKAPRTLEWYQRYLQTFAKHIGKRLKVLDLKPFHVTEWVEKRYGDSSDSTKHGAIRSVQRAFNWALRQGHINRNPVLAIEKPTPRPREVVISPGQFQQMLRLSSDTHETDLLETLWETGCRPQEIRLVEARHFDEPNRRWVFPADESKGKRKSRVVYLK